MIEFGLEIYDDDENMIEAFDPLTTPYDLKEVSVADFFEKLDLYVQGRVNDWFEPNRDRFEYIRYKVVRIT